ncbi:PucR family transcriptional regulator [Mycolicibacterium goodii]|nr:helix-turn-helix domain-containing protein [Mycolicibacterium goodii]MBU8819678.1 helix-turn-helix domain-containing protein [Mycolicibacterium goodii]MBU8833982.1 helix-turn-helix domain-containing protein [Mycolicibacterium goodii]
MAEPPDEAVRDTPTEAADPAPEPSINDLAAYLHARADEIGALIAQRYRDDIVEYRSLPDGFIDQDVAPTAGANLETMLESLIDDSELATEQKSRFAPRYTTFRDSAVRRFRQGVPMQALLHAYRLWGHTVWEEVQNAPQIQANPQLGLVVAGKIMRHVDLVSTAVAEAYLDEASGVIRDREAVRRDLLEALISGDAPPDRIDRLSRHFGIPVDVRHAVVLVRRRQLSSSSPEVLREALEATRAHLQPIKAGFLTGLRDEEIVAVYPLGEDRRHNETLRAQSDALAASSPGFIVGVSRSHTGLNSVADAYLEAQDALLSAPTTGARRAYFYADAMLDHIVRSSPFKTALYEEAIAPLQRYDDEHHAELLPTLRAFCASGFNLSNAAKALIVQPNTVRYRLKRIHEVTGHDPFVPDELILLALALRVI